MKLCPGGTAARTDEQEVTSEQAIPVTKTEIGREAEQKVCVSDKPEDDMWIVTEERVTPGIEGGTRIWETEERETKNKDRRNPETKEQLRTDPKIPIETPRRNGESRHVPGGAWHTQVRSYLTIKFLPEWRRGGRSPEGVEGGLGPAV
ncbi:hypothetical protein NDU88_008800 [Pleurodeles waltl]|uniref:Uncharacterized protein n=1 Tax=Pleurodeles waltl TaxID=8319 RepID=A0AAV7N7I2_PLEWA|nr:hypothetical protein NDU88_008800 [Pleurodeles waltl]